ncbi:TonB-dependent receptor [Verrucomicrobia bacterium LW23]|nr:TonB-dependent receptor [Verrucomicrobia bacterium LW23]
MILPFTPLFLHHISSGAHLAAASATAILCLTATITYAQPETSTQRGREVVVTATKPGNEKRPASLAIPTAESAARTLDKVAGGTNFILADDYKNGRTSTLKDALDYQPGVIAQSRSGGEDSRVTIRGSAIQRTFNGRGILLLQDGFPVNQADGSLDYRSVDSLSAAYIEIYRGANALEYGGSTLGGSVNYVGPTGYNSSPIQLRFEAGSFDYYRAQASSGMVVGNFDYYAGFTHFSQDGFREHSRQNNQRANVNIGWRMNDSVEMRFYAMYATTYSEIPGELTKAQLEADPTQAVGPFPGPVSRFDLVRSNWMRNFETLRFGTRTAIVLDPDQRLDVTASWTGKDMDHPLVWYTDQLSNDGFADIKYTSSCDFLGKSNTLTLGVNSSLGYIEESRFQNNAGNQGRKFFDTSLSAANVTLYAQNEWNIAPDWTLVTGMQAIWANRESEQTQPLTAQSDQDYWGFNPKLGAIWNLRPNAQVFANVSRSFEPPTFGELLGNVPAFPELTPRFDAWTPLDAQTATTVELGTRGTHERFRWDASFYSAWVDDELLAYQTAPGVERTINATATHHIGIEAGFHTVLWEREAGFTGCYKPAQDQEQLLLRQSYTWSSFFFDSDPVYGSNTLPGIPEHYYRAELMYAHPCGFYAGPNVEWSAQKYPIDFANTTFADPYALLGLKLGWKAETSHGDFHVFFEARNLTDQRYAATTSLVTDARGQDAQVYWPGDGRAFYGGLEWKW